MEKREGELKSLFTEELKRQCPNWVVLLQSTAGAPDRIIMGGGRTTAWEFKHATPDFVSPGLQELTCTRMSVQGHCRYVLWQESSSGQRQRTVIAHPRAVMDRNGPLVDPETFCIGYDMKWLVAQVRKAHTL